MRLEPQQVAAIREVVKANFGPDARVWLFGSRADDSLQGGDIDLYIETSLEHGLLDAKIDSKLALRKKIGDVPVDIVIRRFSAPPRGIQKIAIEEGVRL